MANYHLVNYFNAPLNLVSLETSSRVGNIFPIKARNYSNSTLINRLRRSESSFPVHSCSSPTSTSTSTSSSSTSSVEQIDLLVEESRSSDESNCGSKYLVCDYGWGVRRLNENGDEIKEAAQLQAKAFHVPMGLLDGLFFQFFKAEVLSGLIYKLRNSPLDRYACLVAEPTTANQNREKEVVGIVDVTVLRDQNVLQHLPAEADEYLYVSGIAVSTRFRRKKVATALLKACDILSVLWDYEYLVLRAYEDDWGARKLYAKAGYHVISKDPPWMAWIGGKRRVLMIKKKHLRQP